MMNEKMLEIVKLGVDQINKVPVANFSQADRNAVIREKMHELMGTSDKAFDLMAYEKNKHELFEIVREVITQTIADGEGAMSDFYNKFVEETTVDEGNIKEYTIENDAYLTVAKISGNNLDLDRQRIDSGETVPVKCDAYYIKVFEYMKRFITGRMSWEDLIAKVDVSIKKFKDDMVADTFKAAVEGLPANFSYSGSYDKAEIENVLNHVAAANNGSQITLVGTKGALNKLQGVQVANLSDAQKAEYGQKGFLREWAGYVCAELPTLFKANSISEFVFDNDTIYILPSGAKPVKVVVEGDPLVIETNEMAKKDLTREVATIFRIGAIAIFDRLIGTLEIQ